MPRTLVSEEAAAAPSGATDPTILFPQGLVGCESWKRFVLLVNDEEDLPVAVLRCVDDPNISLMITDPTLALAEYDVALTSEERAMLDLTEGEQPQLYCTLSVASDGWLTANLLGPLAVNPRTRRAKQLVLVDSSYSTRHPIVRIGQPDVAEDVESACSS